MDYNSDDLDLAKKYEGSKDSGVTHSNDSDKYEVETNEILDRLEHKWLGEKLEKGIWKRDTKKIKLMNEEGASLLITTIEHIFNKNALYGTLKEDEKRSIIAEICIELENVLTYDYWKYDINPRYNILILNMIEKALRSWLTINEDGNMIHYKAGKNRTVINKQEISSNGGAY